MTNNEKIAMWVGLDSHTCDENAFYCSDCAKGSIQTPNYSTDAGAVELLNIMKYEGLDPSLIYRNDGWYVDYCTTYIDSVGPYSTIHEVITSAVLQIINHEMVDAV